MNVSSVVGAVNSDEWWLGVRRMRGEMIQEIEELKREGGDSDVIRKWYDVLMRFDRMVGDAVGVFVRDVKSLGGGNTFVVVLPNGSVENKVIESVSYEEVSDGGQGIDTDDECV